MAWLRFPCILTWILYVGVACLGDHVSCNICVGKACGMAVCNFYVGLLHHNNAIYICGRIILGVISTPSGVILSVEVKPSRC